MKIRELISRLKEHGMDTQIGIYDTDDNGKEIYVRDIWFEISLSKGHRGRVTMRPGR